MLKRRVATPTLLVTFLAAALLGLLVTAPPAFAASGTIRVSPSTQNVTAPATNFTVTLIQNSSATSQGAQTDLSFNQARLQIQSVALGSAYSGGSLVLGTSGQTHADAIAEANTTGTLQNAAAFLSPPSTVGTGDQNFLVVTMQGTSCGVSPITMTNFEMLDAIGDNMTVTVTNGSVTSLVVDINAPFGQQDWTVPTPPNTDTDCDGFSDVDPGGLTRSSEAHMGTVAAQLCMLNSTGNNEPPPDAWPPDFNDNQLVSGPDLLAFGPVFGAISPNPPYNARFDISGDNRISGPDLLKMGPFFGKKCA